MVLTACMGSWLLCGPTHAEEPKTSDASAVGSDPDGACPAGLDVRSPLSLAAAVDLALCNNAQVRIAWANIRVQAAVVGIARAAYWPTLTATASELHERTEYPSAPTPATQTTGTTVFGSLAWRLFDFGGRSARYKAAKSVLESAVASRDATIQKTLSSVIQDYSGAVTAKAVADDKAQSEVVSRETLASAQRRQAQGDAAQNDVLQATAAWARASLDRNRSAAAYQRAIAELVYTLGIPAGSQVELATDVDSVAGTEQQELAAWLDEAKKRHPAIIAARAAVEAAREQVSAAQATSSPTIDLTANYYQNGFPNEGLTNTNLRAATVGLGVTVPLFDGFAAHYSVEQARAAVRERESQLQDTEQATLLTVVQAYADAHSALLNLNASEDLLKAAEAAFASSQRRYAQGAADMVEVLSAQATFADARSERIRSISDWRSTRLALFAAAGLLTRADLSR